MPELPEVETVVRELRPHVVGALIKSAKFAIPRQLLPQTPALVSRRIRGRKIVAVNRRGKYILLKLDHGTLVLHLRMSGRLYVREGGSALDHERAWIELQPGARTLAFRDVRTLGTIQYYPDDAEIPALRALGWEPLDTTVAPGELRDRLRSRSMAIKPVLLDQSIWAGIGNIYASDSLWVAEIDPRVPANRLSLRQCERLTKSVPAVLTRALGQGGSTLRDFMSPDGMEGSYQKHFRVYDREGEPCSRCHGTIRRIVQAQRSTYFCPGCQNRR
ncbi:bifunctional DNA-formamidopyrimidine glycosylase/DNA-(apurinic or apyrimidinic site) lyase [candidate division KSB1 bacterium]|nr:bifunctional DNA-formamidopyrimidine glycosylase/DNA-(apurinic or apyrimidinic site) lyase [candidate division KSB1 bacterium]